MNWPPGGLHLLRPYHSTSPSGCLWDEGAALPVAHNAGQSRGASLLGHRTCVITVTRSQCAHSLCFVRIRSAPISRYGAFPEDEVDMEFPQKSENMRELITLIGQALVDLPEDVLVEEAPDCSSTRLRLRVAQSDVGKVIGKQGRTAQSLRTILAAVSMKHHHRYSLEILEEPQTDG